MNDPVLSPLAPKVRRVLAFSQGFLPGFKAGGPIKSMVQILDNLPESVKVTLVTADRDLGDNAPYPGLSGTFAVRGIHEIYYLNWRDPTQWLTLLRWTRRNAIDLIYVNSLWSPLFTILPIVARRLGLLKSQEVLLAPRGELSPGAMGLKRTKKCLVLFLWTPCLRRINPVWHASTAMEEDMILRRFPWARTVVASDGSGDDPCSAISVSSDRPQFVFISRITRMKNLLLALKALQLVHVDLDFDIYGPIEDAKYWEECLEAIGELTGSIDVKYLGELRPDQVRETFARYDGFILPTLGENFGHVITESLSTGCPVLSSRNTPWTDVLNRGGGVAIAELDQQVWADEISLRASQKPAQRDSAKRKALAVYSEWRKGSEHLSALETVLDRIPSEPRPAQKRSRRIALVTQGYQTAGGIQTAARWLVAGLQGAGFEVEVFDIAASRSDPYSRRLTSPASWLRSTLVVTDPKNTQVNHVGGNAVEFEPLRYVPRAELSSRLGRFDLIQVVAGGPALALVATRCKRPTVLLVATRVAWERAHMIAETDGFIARWRLWMTKVVSVMEVSAVRRSDAVLVLNSEMCEYARSLGQSRVVIAPTGVDTIVYAPPAGGWNMKGYLLSVCRLSDARKGLDRLIRAYGLMTTRDPSVPELVLAGRGELPRQLLQLIRELGLAGRITVRTDVPEDELASLYRGASVYLQTSHEEGLGISVIEAMATGLPVVCTETAGTIETVVHGKTGWLVPQMPARQVPVVLANRVFDVLAGDGRTMSLRARERCLSLFSMDVAIARFTDTYATLLGGARP